MAKSSNSVAKRPLWIVSVENGGHFARGRRSLAEYSFLGIKIFRKKPADKKRAAEIHSIWLLWVADFCEGGCCG